MNIVSVINGLEGEGKTKELEGDFMDNISDPCMRYYYLSTVESSGVIEERLNTIRKSNPNYASKTSMGVYMFKTKQELERLLTDLSDDSGTIFFIDNAYTVDDFSYEWLMVMMDKYQFDCEVTRLRT